jgi:hypothetical protein
MAPDDSKRAAERSGPDPLRGALAGLVGGLVASAAMNGFQAAWQAAAGSSTAGRGEPATVQAAEKLAQSVGEAPIPEQSKSAAGNTVHYAFGAALGALYGLAAEYVPSVTAARGAAFGIGSMLLFDDAAVPAAGLGEPPTESSLRAHAYSAASHLVYGGALESVRRLIRSRA